jgi:hypothetical protein
MNKIIIFMCILFYSQFYHPMLIGKYTSLNLLTGCARAVLNIIAYFVMHLHAEEVNRDYKLTNDLFRSYKGLKDQLDKDMKKPKECENYSKKL